MQDYSTKRISKVLIEELKRSLKSVASYGSVEIFVQDNIVTQITVRNIKKTVNGVRKFAGKSNSSSGPKQ